MALARYSQKAHARWKTAEAKHAAAAQSLSRERKQRKQLQDDLGRARLQTIDDAAALAKSQAAVKKWEQRMPVINGLMSAIQPMTEYVYRAKTI
jgi:septal ring factor EnvC (AmiA/AmiB activator)